MVSEGCSEDASWLFREMLNFFEYKLEDKQRFANMTGEAFAHALMMCYGTYLVNKMKNNTNTLNETSLQ